MGFSWPPITWPGRMVWFREFEWNLSFIQLNEGRKPSDEHYNYNPCQSHARRFYFLSWTSGYVLDHLSCGTFQISGNSFPYRRTTLYQLYWPSRLFKIKPRPPSALLFSLARSCRTFSLDFPYFLSRWPIRNLSSADISWRFRVLLFMKTFPSQRNRTWRQVSVGWQFRDRFCDWLASRAMTDPMLHDLINTTEVVSASFVPNSWVTPGYQPQFRHKN